MLYNHQNRPKKGKALPHHQGTQDTPQASHTGVTRALGHQPFCRRTSKSASSSSPSSSSSSTSRIQSAANFSMWAIGRGAGEEGTEGQGNSKF